jgi:hypothetical protein
MPPLLKKLRFKRGMRVYVAGAPAGYEAELSEIGSEVERSARVSGKFDLIQYPLHDLRYRRDRTKAAEWPAWTVGQLAEACCSGAGAGGTVMCPRGNASSASTRRARVAAQYLGASSRYRSRGQYGMTRKMSAR